MADKQDILDWIFREGDSPTAPDTTRPDAFLYGGRSKEDYDRDANARGNQITSDALEQISSILGGGRGTVDLLTNIIANPGAVPLTSNAHMPGYSVTSGLTSGLEWLMQNILDPSWQAGMENGPGDSAFIPKDNMQILKERSTASPDPMEILQSVLGGQSTAQDTEGDAMQSLMSALSAQSQSAPSDTYVSRGDTTMRGDGSNMAEGMRGGNFSHSKTTVPNYSEQAAKRADAAQRQKMLLDVVSKVAQARDPLAAGPLLGFVMKAMGMSDAAIQDGLSVFNKKQ